MLLLSTAADPPKPSGDDDEKYRPAPFLNAVTSLKKVVASRGLSQRLMWVFREHVVVIGSRIFVQDPPPLDTFHRTRVLYKQRRDSGTPAVLSVLCALRPNMPNEATVCYISNAPLNPDDETRFRYPLQLRDGIGIRSKLSWRAVQAVSHFAAPSALHQTLPEYAGE